MAKNRFILHIPTLGPNGMALFPFILVKRANPDPVLLNHERIHLRQQLELGIVPFYLWYVLEYMVYRIRYRGHYVAYRAIRFEREAFAHEADLNYMKHRPFWAFLKE